MAEARLNRDYARRMLGVALLMAALAAWSLYDGLAGWPRLNARMAAARPALLATNLAAEAWLGGETPDERPLHRVFAAQGLTPPRKLVRKMGELRLPPRPDDLEPALAGQRAAVRRLLEAPLYTAEDLRTQFIQAGLTLLLALAAAGLVAVKRGRIFIADETGLHGSGFRGSRTWPELAAVDWRRWDEKGIFVLTFASGAAVRCDGWHFAGMSAIVAEIEKQRPDLAPPQPPAVGE
jgi:hypothetical protein